MKEADTTKPAVTAMRRTSIRRNVRSEDILDRHPAHAGFMLYWFDRHRDLRAVLDGLIDHAIALGEFLQQIELVLPRAGCDLEAQADLGEADRRFLVDAERATEIEIALCDHVAFRQRHLDRGRDRFQGDARAGDERFQ